MQYNETMRYKRYYSLSKLLQMLVTLKLKNHTSLGSDWDKFHERMGTPPMRYLNGQ